MCRPYISPLYQLVYFQNSWWRTEGQQLTQVYVDTGVCVVELCLFSKRYGDSVDNTAENYSVFSLIGMHWLPPARACGQ